MWYGKAFLPTSIHSPTTVEKASDDQQALSNTSSTQDVDIKLELSMIGDGGFDVVLAAGASDAAAMPSFVHKKRHRTGSVSRP